MDIRNYYDVNITNKGFQVAVLPHKVESMGAIEILKKIETIVKDRLVYFPSSLDDPFKYLNEEDQRLRLKHIAYDINVRYSKKNENNTDKVEKVKALYLSIETVVSPPWDFSNPEMMLRIFQLLDQQDLFALGQVSKEWEMLSQDNSLWKSIYLSYFPKASQEINSTPHAGYWKGKFCNYLKNLKKGQYAETILPRNFIEFFHVPKACLVNHGKIVGEHFIELIKNQYDEYTRQNGGNFDSVLINVNQLGTLHANAYTNIIRLYDLIEGLFCDISFPSNIRDLLEGHDRIFVVTIDDKLYAIGRKQNGILDSNPSRIEAYEEKTHILASWNEWVVINKNSQIYMLKRDENDLYSEHQKLDCETPDFSKFSFFRSGGNDFMLQETTPPERNTIFCWKYDVVLQKWSSFQKFDEAKLLTANNEFIFLSDFPGKANKINNLLDSESQDYDWKRSIKGYKYSETGYLPIYCFENCLHLKVYTNNPHTLTSDFRLLWNDYTYASLNNHLFTQSPRDLIYYYKKVFVFGNDFKKGFSSSYESRDFAFLYPQIKSGGLLGITPEGEVVTAECQGVVLRNFSKEENLYIFGSMSQ